MNRLRTYRLSGKTAVTSLSASQYRMGEVITFVAKEAGQVVKLENDLKLARTWESAGAGDSLTVVCYDGENWAEVARKYPPKTRRRAMADVMQRFIAAQGTTTAAMRPGNTGNATSLTAGTLPLLGSIYIDPADVEGTALYSIEAEAYSNSADPGEGTLTIGLYLVEAVSGAASATLSASTNSLISASKVEHKNIGLKAMKHGRSGTFELVAGVYIIGCVISFTVAANSTVDVVARLAVESKRP